MGSSPATPTTSEWTLLHSDFSLQKNRSYAPSFLLYRKKARSARLFARKRSQRLTAATTFLRVAPAAQIPRQGGVGFSIGRDSNPERAKSVKKAAGGRFFSFLVRRRVPKCEAFGSSSSGDAQSAAPSRHSDHIRTKVMIPLVLQLSFFFFLQKSLFHKPFRLFYIKDKFQRGKFSPLFAL